MTAYDSGFGAGVIATWFACLLYGIGITHAFHYFSKFPNDILLKKIILVVVVFLSTCGLVGECAAMYLQAVTYWGDPRALTVIMWPAPFGVLCNSLVVFIVNSFLTHRFYAVSKNLIVAFILFALNLGTFITSLLFVRLLGIQVGKTAIQATAQSLVPLSTAWSAAGVATDALIAGSLVWTLRGMKTSFKHTTQLLQHIMAVCIQNGCTTSIVAIAGMIAKIVVPASEIDNLFNFLIGPLFLLTLLSNLTLRESAPGVRTWLSGGIKDSNSIDSNNSIIFGGVHVHRSVTTTGAASEDIEAARTESSEDERTVRSQERSSTFSSKKVRFSGTSC
ncbi:hypothetical protein C8F04DRAFT_1396655 [Mycena alexandri]|uniref:DUF6534 domain-containing protein n=1 Tax=Mycena alexandri TaxID=1745969 RepID=A0AAD6X0U0_9AGAR|nr:hypothetical protein C8F04DRAFT_1396655 [Mycena alexandri]